MSWRITLSPCAMVPGDETALSASVAGDVITINGDDLDLSAMADGDTLPASAVEHALVVGSISRVNGEIEITLILPVMHNSPEAARFPSPIVMTADGPVPLPQVTP